MKIVHAHADDLSVIYQLFEAAIAFQKERNYIGWLNYDREFIQKDIDNALLYKVVRGHEIVAIFSICFSDILIWREKEKGDALYIHRIVLNRQFAGIKIFHTILEWFVGFAGQKNLKYIRMDTWASNQKIIDYYRSYGFVFIENYTTANTADLPVQHRNLQVALLELDIESLK